jgi:hypothetical protein
MKRDIMNNLISEIFDDESNLEILNKSLLSQQSTLRNYLNLDLTNTITKEDHTRIQSSIQRIDDILDMIENYSKLKKVEKVTLQDPS